MAKQELEAKGIVRRDQAVAHLEQLLALLKSGGVCLTAGEQCVCLDVPELVKLKVEAEGKNDKGSLTLEVAWKGEMRDETGLDLAISATPPAGCCREDESRAEPAAAP